MTDLNKYNAAFTKKLDEQLAVYTTIGTAYVESPMWFQFNQFNVNDFYFKSSQCSYMYFSIEMQEEGKRLCFEFNTVYNHFRDLKYKHIKENWPTVYYEIRQNEKPIVKDVPAFRPTEETDYQKQATDFLTAAGTAFKSVYFSHDYYFSDDKETRDIYKITLKNDKHKYSFKFGQSITNTGSHPTAYDVLACLTKDEVGTFENFCSEYGYDLDSRKAYKTYKAVMKEWKNIELLFTAEQLEQLQEIN